MIGCLLMVQTNNHLSPLTSTNKQSSLTITINKQSSLTITINKQPIISHHYHQQTNNCLFVDDNGER
jgi:hypothetical protein